MTLQKSILDTPRENAGSISSNRFDFQKDWAICKLLELHEQKTDYVLILDFQEDTLNALRQNQTLNGKAIEWDCSRVGYEFRTWPVRGFIMEIVIHARRSY